MHSKYKWMTEYHRMLSEKNCYNFESRVWFVKAQLGTVENKKIRMKDHSSSIEIDMTYINKTFSDIAYISFMIKDIV